MDECPQPDLLAYSCILSNGSSGAATGNGNFQGRKKNFQLKKEKCSISQEGVSVPWSELVFIAEHFALLSFNCICFI